MAQKPTLSRVLAISVPYSNKDTVKLIALGDEKEVIDHIEKNLDILERFNPIKSDATVEELEGAEEDNPLFFIGSLVEDEYDFIKAYNVNRTEECTVYLFRVKDGLIDFKKISDDFSRAII
jgi:hypothetical protein